METESSSYVFVNTNYLQSQIKQVLKNEVYGKLTREEAALALHALADKLALKHKSTEQLTLDGVGERVQEHLAQNRRKRYGNQI